MLDDNKAIARKVYEDCWNRGKVNEVDELYSTACRYHDPVFPSLGPGTESMRRHIQNCRTAFPDLTFSIEDMIAEKEEVVVHWTGHGTQRGQFLGVPATNRKASVSGTSIFRFKNGKIVEQWSDWNLLTLLEQLGVTTTPRVEVAAR